MYEASVWLGPVAGYCALGAAWPLVVAPGGWVMDIPVFALLFVAWMPALVILALWRRLARERSSPWLRRAVWAPPWMLGAAAGLFVAIIGLGEWPWGLVVGAGVGAAFGVGGTIVVAIVMLMRWGAARLSLLTAD